MYQPYPPSGQPVEPLRPPAPALVLTAVKLMYVGAAVSTVEWLTVLAVTPGINAAFRKAHPSPTAAQISDLNTSITLAIVSGLVVIALWLWMARANGQGRNWARILSTVLFVLATLELIRVRPQRAVAERFGGHAPVVIHYGFGVTVLGVIVPVLTWLVGLAAVWLLWRPDSSAFFKPRGFTQAGHSAQPSSRIRSSRARLPRRW
jgi:hypothetical protein